MQNFSRPGQLLDQREKFVVVSTVIVELDLTDELDFDPLVLQPVGLAVQCHVHLQRQIDDKMPQDANSLSKSHEMAKRKGKIGFEKKTREFENFV